jgi:hypothetical protein
MPKSRGKVAHIDGRPAKSHGRPTMSYGLLALVNVLSGSHSSRKCVVTLAYAVLVGKSW